LNSLKSAPDPFPFLSARALELARKAVALNPNHYGIANTLVLAEYRNGHLDPSIAASERSMNLGQGGTPYDWFLLGLAHANKGRTPRVRTWFDKAVPAAMEADPESKVLGVRALWTESAGRRPIGVRADVGFSSHCGLPRADRSSVPTLPQRLGSQSRPFDDRALAA
jgi:hypothetical protein